MKPKMHMTDVDHRRPRCDPALLGLTIAPIPSMPRVCALHHPAFRPRGAALSTLGTCRHLDALPGPMLGHSGLPSLVMRLLLCTDRHATR